MYHLQARVSLHWPFSRIQAPQEGTSMFQLRENVSFITASPSYAWLNQLQGWGLGTVDPVKGKVQVKAYAA